ncbi:hypothetical protein ACFOY5_10675 [Massilia aurea]|uniref:hypothetical protein n=1 Tax=Massilia aurea TaxID=373040 RepID=UPI0031E2C61A
MILESGGCGCGLARGARDPAIVFCQVVQEWEEIGPGLADQVVHQGRFACVVAVVLEAFGGLNQDNGRIAQITCRVSRRDAQRLECFLDFVAVVVQARHAARKLYDRSVDAAHIFAKHYGKLLDLGKAFDR